MENFRYKSQIHKNGFTLADVLITLVIVGVVAAMTIPTLINTTQKQEYVSRLKKTYSTLTQVTNKIIAEEGNPRADIGGWASSGENVYNLYKVRLNNAKDCGSNTGCFQQRRYKNIEGNEIWYDLETYGNKLILSDGVQVFFDNTSSNCNAADWWTTTVNACEIIWVDVNGEKKPNIVGRDLFAFELRESGLFPRGCEANNCSKNWSVNCACRVLRENAMNY